MYGPGTIQTKPQKGSGPEHKDLPSQRRTTSAVELEMDVRGSESSQTTMPRGVERVPNQADCSMASSWQAEQDEESATTAGAIKG